MLSGGRPFRRNVLVRDDFQGRHWGLEKETGRRLLRDSSRDSLFRPLTGGPIIHALQNSPSAGFPSSYFVQILFSLSPTQPFRSFNLPAFPWKCLSRIVSMIQSRESHGYTYSQNKCSRSITTSAAPIAASSLDPRGAEGNSNEQGRRNLWGGNITGFCCIREPESRQARRKGIMPALWWVVSCRLRF